MDMYSLTLKIANFRLWLDGKKTYDWKELNPIFWALNTPIQTRTLPTTATQTREEEEELSKRR